MHGGESQYFEIVFLREAFDPVRKFLLCSTTPARANHQPARMSQSTKKARQLEPALYVMFDKF